MLNEVNWSQDYLPGTTDNFASNEIIVKGISAKDVFDNLIDTSIGRLTTTTSPTFIFTTVTRPSSRRTRALSSRLLAFPLKRKL